MDDVEPLEESSCGREVARMGTEEAETKMKMKTRGSNTKCRQLSREKSGRSVGSGGKVPKVVLG